MQKRLKKTDYMMAYMIIITLACTIGGFFFGAYFMKAQIESAQAAALEAEQREAEKERLLQEQKLYNEQDFIRFHYAVYAPVLSLKSAHFETMDNWAQMDRNAQSDSLEKLVRTAEETLAVLQKEVALPTSPLLQQAHDNFTTSVRAYLDCMEQVRTDQNSNALTTSEIGARLAPLQESWLKAQEQLYLSFATWESAYVSKQPLPQAAPETVTIEQWKQYPFHYRTYVSAVAMTGERQWKAFNPEDLTVRLDSLLSSSDAATFGIRDVAGAVRLLYATDAIHPGDFKQFKTKFLPDLKAPEVPLYN